MALPRTFLHTILFLQSVFLYWAVLRFYLTNGIKTSYFWKFVNYLYPR